MTAIGHNSDKEALAEQTFLSVFREIKERKSAIGEEMGEINEAYKRLKVHGFTKADIKFAMELEEKDAGDVIATMQRRIRIAKMFGHGLARQFDMFEEDRTPLEERAYEEGLAAGKLRKGQGANPYDATSAAGQAWLKGEAEGNAFANADLSSALEQDEPFPDETAEAAE
ncbi:ribosome modulation factor [Nitratireductor basaltis]|uniref:Uncharacterized protein n=1 Tax=Nitratireductor basaltis TaxID=472175 RepID=A0A084UBM3_9HYPH|nr:hypothetical protein [Nitratireductor basaltis]KFB10359.1 hypothetical protein EL18_01390 [Nitratireductor basaltis]